MPVAPLRVDDGHLDAAQAGLQTGNPWLVTVAAHLYLDAEAVSRERIDQLRTMLPTLTPAARLDAALCIRAHDAGADLDLTDAPTRAGAATASAIVHMQNGDPLALVHALGDPDLLVREMVARVITDVPEGAAAVLRRALDQEAQQWTCIWCGRVNPATASSCPEPRSHSRPTPRIPEVGPTP